MLAGGSEAAIIPSGVGGFIACRALSNRNAEPTKASRPWDKNRDGFVMGEGEGEPVMTFLIVAVLCLFWSRMSFAAMRWCKCKRAMLR